MAQSLFIPVKVFQNNQPTTRRYKKWYGRVAKSVADGGGTVDEARLVAQIEKKCTLTEADLKGAISALKTEIHDSLCAGQSVRLDGIGTFSPAINTKAADERDEFTIEKNVTRVRVAFTPAYTIDLSGKRAIGLLSGAKLQIVKNLSQEGSSEPKP